VPFAAVVASMMLGGVLRPAWAVAFAHFALLFVGSVVCHQALARRRPPVQRLTEFYLLMSVGGVLGGVWNGLVAPVVFDDLLEYPVAIGLVCAARLFVEKTGREHVRRDVAWGLGLGAVTFGLVRLGAAIGARPATAVVWMFGAPVLCALAWRKSPTRYGVALACIMLAGMTYGGSVGQVTWRHRNFFGALKVARDPTGRYLTLVYGRTMHGQQALDPRARRVPLAYYHPTGPAGDVLDVPSGGRRVGVIGLTVGSLAAYAMPGDRWTFFEENPAVVEVARNQFTFLRDVPVGARVEVEVGDARLRLRQGPAARFDVLVLDAFSSDAVPIQLVTRQALEVYRRALAPGGVLLAHVSNRYVRLPPVFAALAKDAGMVCVERRDDHVAPALAAAGKVDSDWVLLASSADAVRLVSLKNAEWHTLVAPEGQPVWSDGFANVLGAMQL
jgi:spermidine synthase